VLLDHPYRLGIENLAASKLSGEEGQLAAGNRDGIAKSLTPAQII